MKYNSIAFRILSLIVGAFIIGVIGILLTAKYQLSRIIDHSQLAVYSEKIATVTDFLQRSNVRLQKTGLVDAYRDDFQQTALQNLRQVYYKRLGHAIVLLIFAGDGEVVMQPQQSSGDQRLNQSSLAKKIPAAAAGEFNYTCQGRQYWCIYQHFPAWKWTIVYTVPLQVKYADVRQFISLLAMITGGIGLITLLGLLLMLHRAIIRPIVHLSKGARAIATGDLERPIESGNGGNDEINDLSRSFSVMRDSIRRMIAELKNENSQRRRAQQDLAAEKERLIVTLRSIGDGVITTDISGRVELLNKVAEQLTGWSLEEAVGQPLEEVFHIVNDQTGERCETPFAKVISSGQVVGLANHTSLLARDGRRSSLADSGAPIFDADSNIVGVVIVFRDVTEQIRTARELLKVKKLESIGVLAGGIAHDFNNILMAIMGNINLALFDDSLSARTKGLLTEAEKAMMRAKDLSQQLLTFSKGGAPIKAAASLEAVIMDSANFVLHGDKVACRYAIADDLWLVDIDKGQISQVIQNIVINAAHAMPQGGTINISCENISAGSTDIPPDARAGDFVKVVIADSGTGIHADVLERIFDPYFTTNRKGSGLGLAISQSIIAKHGGHILAESRVGLGSSFTIYLPASEKLATGQIRPLPDVTAVLTAAAKARILIMDDDKLVRNVALAMLGQLGHEVETAADGEEAISVYGRALKSGGKFDLVIMDLTIPGGMGGKEAVRGILDLDPGAKVIVSSGYSNDPVLARFAEYGFCAALVKPYRLQDMSALIASILVS